MRLLPRSLLFGLGLLALLAAVLLLDGIHLPAYATGSLAVANLTQSELTPDIYDKLELTFDVTNTVATNLFFPYDPAPNSGVPARVGISVEGLFRAPGASWSEAITIPAFLYQDYDRALVGTTEWEYPTGGAQWKIRFAPKVLGYWEYKVRVQDASICAEGVSPCDTWVEDATHSFIVVYPDPGNHGFVRVSPNDTRYFAYSDGTRYAGLGYNDYYAGNISPTYLADIRMPIYESADFDMVRLWMMQAASVFGSAFAPWDRGTAYYGYVNDGGFRPAPADSPYSITMNITATAPQVSPWRLSLKPSTVYSVAVTTKVEALVGSGTYGLRTSYGAGTCATDTTSESWIGYVHDTDFTTVYGRFSTSPSQYFITNTFRLCLSNVSEGGAYIADVSVREDNGGVLGPNLLPKGGADPAYTVNDLNAWRWDYFFDLAQQHGVSIKAVMMEKSDKAYTYIMPTGEVTSTDSDSYFYASATSPVRTLQEYASRYAGARWGYSRGIHSWEYINEGDPYSGSHYSAAEAFCAYMHSVDPNHLCTTSMWHSYRPDLFWGNDAYPDVDYGDVHAYIGTNYPYSFGNYEWTAPTNTSWETDTTKTYLGSRGAIRVEAGEIGAQDGYAVKGQGDWNISVLMKAENMTGTAGVNCTLGLAGMYGPQIVLYLGGGWVSIPPYPPDPTKSFYCTSPAGTYDYTPFSITVAITDTGWHSLYIRFNTQNALTGTAWFDNLVVRAPNGQNVRIYGDGTFDTRDRIDQDSAWYHEVYALRYGAAAVDSGKPIVRGEAGIYSSTAVIEYPELVSDTHGVWLHNFLWANLNPGGLYEQYWNKVNIDANNLYFQFVQPARFLNFIPLDNGHYVDAAPTASVTTTRVMGQKDLTNQRAHLWMYPDDYNWWDVANGIPYGQLQGTVTIAGFTPAADYPTQWWMFDLTGTLGITTTTITADGSGDLTFDLTTLPVTCTDVALKVGDYSAAFSVGGSVAK